ncbi:hypothetical protein ACIPIN_13380 [Pseudomonas sp. NPDC087697]|uniref:hypothetical protein n=1 Tax=Pseudomonas sp. NPDC087697 TaxID=3364447 RepID=UPI003824E442
MRTKQPADQPSRASPLSIKHLLLIAALLSPIVPYPTALASPSAHEAAVNFVAQQHLGKYLRSMAVQVIQMTQSYITMTVRIGPIDAYSAVDRELDQLLPAYQPQWDENLANAYEKFYTAEELSSLATEGKASKYFAQMAIRQNAVAEEMRSHSDKILSGLAGAALGKAVRFSFQPQAE